ncbi:MAG: imidazole glycerol phosphate synthase subunit HisH [Planctomycetota bacterium]
MNRKPPTVSVVSTGVANVASVLAAFRRLGVEPLEIDRPEQVEQAQWLVLPGVGAFAAAMRAIEERQLADSLRARILAGRPTLAICLGLQLLASSSEESPGVRGLGIWTEQVVRLRAERVPQLGWNQVVAATNSRYFETGHAYYENSFCLQSEPAGWTASWSDHEGRFVAALERDEVLACQFHPELSGSWGEQLLSRWLGGGRC